MCVFFFGDIAQLVERLNGIEKVRGSTPLISTIKIVCKIRVFLQFWSANEPAQRWRCRGFTTFYNTSRVAERQKVCTHT